MTLTRRTWQVLTVTERQTAALQQATKETLYVPLIDVQKYKAKAVIDMFIDRLGKAISAIALILATSVAGLSIRVLLTIAVVAILVWIWSADGLGRRYAVRAADRVDDAA